jgi:phage/plasmid-like protein (TIGR03299 family)
MTAECHWLEQDVQGTRMAYSDAEVPWHRLGTPMPADMQTPELMLAAARANFEVNTYRVIAADENGPITNMVYNDDGSTSLEYVYVDDSRATVRCDVWGDGKFTGLSTVGTRYVATQNEAVLARALAVVNAAPGAAIVDTVGVMDEGRQFFASLRLTDLDLILPNGKHDMIARYLNVRTSHDGKIPIAYFLGNIRMVCRNTVTASYNSALQKYTARHTKNSVADFMSDSMIDEARNALSITVKQGADFQKVATDLGSIEISGAMVDKFLQDMFPVDTSATDRVQDAAKARQGIVRGLYANERNAGEFGQNGWSLYNATVEYFDHQREGTAAEKARTSFDLGSWVNKAKGDAQDRILAFAN